MPSRSEMVALCGATSIEGQVRYSKKRIGWCVRKRMDPKTTAAERAALTRLIQEHMQDADDFDRERSDLERAAGSLLMDLEGMKAYTRHLVALWSQPKVEPDNALLWQDYIEACEAAEVAELLAQEIEDAE